MQQGAVSEGMLVRGHKVIGVSPQKQHQIIQRFERVRGRGRAEDTPP